MGARAAVLGAVRWVGRRGAAATGRASRAMPDERGAGEPLRDPDAAPGDVPGDTDPALGGDACEPSRLVDCGVHLGRVGGGGRCGRRARRRVAGEVRLHLALALAPRRSPIIARQHVAHVERHAHRRVHEQSSALSCAGFSSATGSPFPDTSAPHGRSPSTGAQSTVPGAMTFLEGLLVVGGRALRRDHQHHRRLRLAGHLPDAPGHRLLARWTPTSATPSASCSASMSGAVGYRRELGGQRHRATVLGTASLTGGITGAVLLLTLPSSVFDAVVPVLILLAVRAGDAAAAPQPLRGRAPAPGNRGWGRDRARRRRALDRACSSPACTAATSAPPRA